MFAARWPLFVLGASLCFSAACTTPPPPPLKADSAIVGVRVATTAPLGLGSQDAEQVYFVRMDASGKFSGEQVIPSNYASDGYVFLLNAEPGTYAAVASQKTATSSAGMGAPVGGGFSAGVGVTITVDMVTYMPEAVITHTIVDVKPGTAAFMGEFVIDQHTDFEEADELQLHYYRLMQPGNEGKSVLTQAFSGNEGYCGELEQEDRSANALNRFLKEVGPRLDKAGWSNAVAHPVQPHGN
jgi:hypothetical protein